MKFSVRQAGSVFLVLLALAACDTATDEPDHNKGDLAAGRVCGGALSGDSARALEAVSGATKFSEVAPGGGMRGVVTGITEQYPGQVGKAKDYGLCQVYATSGEGLDLEISYSLSDEKSAASGGEDPAFVKYAIGRKALATVGKAVLYYDCVSAKLPGSAGAPAIIRGELNHRQDPTGNAQEVGERNLTILNSASLALAKNLGCERNGKLVDKPALTPAS